MGPPSLYNKQNYSTLSGPHLWLEVESALARPWYCGENQNDTLTGPQLNAVKLGNWILLVVPDSESDNTGLN